MSLLIGVAGCTTSPVQETTSSTEATVVPSVLPFAGISCPDAGTLSDTSAPFGDATPERAIIYLPGCYDRAPQRKFSVLFLLHGADAEPSQWPDVGIASAADALIAAGVIPPLIIVMADGGTSMPDALVDGLTDRLVPWADHTFRTIAERRGRGVGGISRGGRIALLAAARHPELFAVVAGHSPAVGPADSGSMNALTAMSHDVGIDVGLQDPLRGGVEAYASQLGLTVSTAPGRHDRAYWREHAADYLTFYGMRLAPPP